MEVRVLTDRTVGDLIDLKSNLILQVNREYQRGLRWSKSQKQMFIDSIYRGYSIPAFYFHKKETSAAGITNKYYDIVDGQQRIDAIYSYSEGAYPLLDPSNKSEFRFPNFVKDNETTWGGKRFNELHETEREKLKSHKVVIYEITTTNENEIRDLFIRLQAGTPLNPQDKRDSWPGSFTEFVLRIGGKTGVDRWYGMPLFKAIAKVSNESNRRKLVAQTFMLFWTFRKEVKLVDIKSSNLDEVYHSQVGFDQSCYEAQRFKKICESLTSSFTNSPRIVGHFVIHLILLVDSLLEEYVQGTWENELARGLHEYERRLRDAIDANNKGQSSKYSVYYTEYGQWTRTGSDNARSIRRRHAFFAKEMLYLIAPRKLDSRRLFTDHERRIVFFRDSESCQFCRMEANRHSVSWNECEIHHVTPYVDGGRTSVENAALVHRECHPRNRDDVEKFRKWWLSRMNVDQKKDTEPLLDTSELSPVLEVGQPRGQQIQVQDQNKSEIVAKAAYSVLLEAGRPLHYLDITQSILENGLWVPRGTTPEKTVSATITREIRQNGSSSRFQRVTRGVYQANEAP